MKAVCRQRARCLVLHRRRPVRHGPAPWVGWQEPGDNDAIHTRATSKRRYIWRKVVIDAEPSSEIVIEQEEMKRVERQLDAYR